MLYTVLYVLYIWFSYSSSPAQLLSVLILLAVLTAHKGGAHIQPIPLIADAQADAEDAEDAADAEDAK